MRRPKLAVLALMPVVLSALNGCSDSSARASNEVTLVIGYQSKTINTVTAGTLLRGKGYVERELTALGNRTGMHYDVEWQDYATGAPITGEMVAGKIDIGSMGDYPLLINGSRAQEFGDGPTSMISVTGYNARGALNMIVVAPDSDATTLADLEGARVSSSVGSAGDGLLVHALDSAGIDANDDVQRLNQQPAVGATALSAGSVDALAQFPAWPGQLVWDGTAKLLYDGASLDLPTLHGVVVRDAYAEQHPEVVEAFLRAQRSATDFLHRDPIAAAELVAEATGLPPEVVYLYNGRGGLVSFDQTIKPMQRDALSTDIPFLQSMRILKDLDLDGFIDESYLKRVYGDAYERAVDTTDNPSPITGTDPVCHGPVTDPMRAGEVWLKGAKTTQPARDPVCLLRQVKEAGDRVRVAYVPDAEHGTRWYADKCVWVLDQDQPRDNRLLPFATEAGAEDYVDEHGGAEIVSYEDALAAV